MSAFLQLVSARNNVSIRGWGDPDWPGWIPILSFSWGVQNYVAGGANAGGGQATGRRQSEPLHLSAAMDQFDSPTLLRWAANGELADGKLNVVPNKPGETGFGFLLTGAAVTSVDFGGGASSTSSVSFTLQPGSVERRFLLRFR